MRIARTRRPSLPVLLEKMKKVGEEREEASHLGLCGKTLCSFIRIYLKATSWIHQRTEQISERSTLQRKKNHAYIQPANHAAASAQNHAVTGQELQLMLTLNTRTGEMRAL